MFRVQNQLNDKYYDPEIPHENILFDDFLSFSNPPVKEKVDFWRENFEEMVTIIQKILNKNATKNYKNIEEGLYIIEEVSSTVENMTV